MDADKGADNDADDDGLADVDDDGLADVDDDGLTGVVDDVGIGEEDALYRLGDAAVGVADDLGLPGLLTLLLNVGDVGWSRARRFCSRSSLNSRDGTAPFESARFLIRSWRSRSISARLIPKIAAGDESVLSTTAT